MYGSAPTSPLLAPLGAALFMERPSPPSPLPQVTAPFLIPEMVDRLAGMLNYFLKYLTGSERRRLAIRDPEKYSFKPRELLLSIIQVRREGGGAQGGRGPCLCPWPYILGGVDIARLTTCKCTACCTGVPASVDGGPCRSVRPGDRRR